MFSKFKSQNGSVGLVVILALLAATILIATTLAMTLVYYKQNSQNTGLYNANKSAKSCQQAAGRIYDSLIQAGSCAVGQCLSWQAGAGSCVSCGSAASQLATTTDDSCFCQAEFQSIVVGQNYNFDFIGYCPANSIAVKRSQQTICLPNCDGVICGLPGGLGTDDGCGNPCLCPVGKTCQNIGGGDYQCA